MEGLIKVKNCRIRKCCMEPKIENLIIDDMEFEISSNKKQKQPTIRELILEMRKDINRIDERLETVIRLNNLKTK